MSMHAGSKVFAIPFLALALASQGASQGNKGADPLQGHSLDYWTKRVSSSRWRDAKEALVVLRTVGPQAASAMTAVLRATRRKEVGADAVRTLMSLGPLPKRAIQPLLKCLAKPTTRNLAIRALGSMGTKAKESRTAITRLVHVAESREVAFQALDKLGVDKLALLVKDLKGKRWRTDALGRIHALGGKAVAAASDVVKVLEFYPRYVAEIGGLSGKTAIQAQEKAKQEFKARSKKAAKDRALAAQTLGKMGTPARALSALGKAAMDFDAEVAKSAAWALMVSGSRESVPVLTKAVDSRRPKNLEYLFAGLVRFGPGSSRAVLTLKKLARRSGKVGQLSAKAVGQIEQTLSFVKRSRSQDPAQRREAAVKLLPYGPASLPALIAALQLGDDALNREVARRISDNPSRFLHLDDVIVAYPGIPKPRLDPVPFVPLLMEYIRDSDPFLASACCRALGAIGLPRAEHAIPALREIVVGGKDSPHARIAGFEALLALGIISGLPEAKIKTFLPYFGSKQPGVAKQCARLFGLLGTHAEPHVDSLVELLGSGKIASHHASDALVRLGSVALPGLVKALRNDRSPIRLRAVQTLSVLGSRAVDAITALHRVASDDADDQVREAAHLALSKIQSK